MSCWLKGQLRYGTDGTHRTHRSYVSHRSHGFSANGTMIRTLAFLSVLALCGPALAASPSLGSVQPRGAQRGTDAVFTLSGGALADAQEVVFYSPGLTVTKLEV